MNTHVRDNENALLGGLVGVGFTLLDVLGAASDPGVSVASHIVLYYNTTTNRVKVSKNGASYVEFGEAGLTDWITWAGGI